MPRLLARVWESGFVAGGWREPGLQGDSLDWFELLKPELLLVALLLGGGALLAAVFGLAIGWAWRTFIRRETSWWWFLGLSLLLGVVGVGLGVVLLLRGFV